MMYVSSDSDLLFREVSGELDSSFVYFLRQAEAISTVTLSEFGWREKNIPKKKKKNKTKHRLYFWAIGWTHGCPEQSF